MTQRQLEQHSAARQAAVNSTGADIKDVSAIDEDPSTITVHIKGRGAVDVSKSDIGRKPAVVEAKPEPARISTRKK